MVRQLTPNVRLRHSNSPSSIPDVALTMPNCPPMACQAAIVANNGARNSWPMRQRLFLAALLWLSGCAQTEEHQRAELIGKIEQSIHLPVGAYPLSAYARVYKFSSQDRVTAFYFVPDVKHDQWFCDGAKKGGRTNGQVALACPPPKGMKADERRWFGDDVYLPDVCDGGCGYIDVEYNVKSGSVISAKCHGRA